MTTAVLPAQRTVEAHWTCALCGFDFPHAPCRVDPTLCRECARGPLGHAVTDVARRMLDVSQWAEREAQLATITLRHLAVVALLEVAAKGGDVDPDRFHTALLRELTAPLVWRGPDYERALFRAAFGRDAVLVS